VSTSGTSGLGRGSGGDVQRHRFEDQVGRSAAAWDAPGISTVRCAGALGHVVLELRRDDAVLLADQEPGRQLAPQRPLARLFGECLLRRLRPAPAAGTGRRGSTRRRCAPPCPRTTGSRTSCSGASCDGAPPIMNQAHDRCMVAEGGPAASQDCLSHLRGTASPPTARPQGMVGAPVPSTGGLAGDGPVLPPGHPTKPVCVRSGQQPNELRRLVSRLKR
jgi:hypothetical protein